MSDTSVSKGTLARAIRGIVAGAAFTVVVGAGSGFLSPPPAKAQFAVVCANCSEIFTQLFEYAEQLLQYAKQIQQYQKQIEQYQNQLKNTDGLSFLVMDRALGTIRSFENTLNNGFNIRYTMQNIDAELERLYPDNFRQMDFLRGRRANGANSSQWNFWTSAGEHWIRSLQSYSSTRSLLKAAKQHSDELRWDQQRMDQVEAQLGGADGRMKALQAAGAYAQQSAQQMMKLRQVALMQLQVAAQNEADKARLEDLKKAEELLWIEKRPRSPYGTSRRYWGF